jgi:hypothetical protein
MRFTTKEAAGMAERQTTEIEDRLAEAEAQIESLQAAAADAEARAATAAAEAEALKGEANTARADLEAAAVSLRQSAAKYRDARLAAAPEIPPELVPEADSIEDVERSFEAAKRVVAEVRDRIGKGLAPSRVPSVPAGSPPRREQDLSGLPPIEKIKIGLQKLSEREGR